MHRKLGPPYCPCAPCTPCPPCTPCTPCAPCAPARTEPVSALRLSTLKVCGGAEKEHRAFVGWWLPDVLQWESSSLPSTLSASLAHSVANALQELHWTRSGARSDAMIGAGILRILGESLRCQTYDEAGSSLGVRPGTDSRKRMLFGFPSARWTRPRLYISTCAASVFCKP